MNSAQPRNDFIYARVFSDIHGEGKITRIRSVMVANER